MNNTSNPTEVAMNENTTLETEARVIRVHETHRDEFDTKIDKANRRLARHGIDGHFEATLVNTVAVEHRDGSVEYFYEYTLNSPSFEYAGWEFLATIEIMDGGTLLRIAPSVNVPPLLPGSDSSDAALGDTESSSEFGVSVVAGSNRPNVVVGELGVMPGRADNGSPSASGVGSVVAGRSEPQVGGLNADGSIAGVQDESITLDGSVEQGVGHPVGTHIAVDAALDGSVTGSPDRAGPVPASLGGAGSVGRVTGHGETEGLLVGDASGLASNDTGVTVSPESAVVRGTESTRTNSVRAYIEAALGHVPSVHSCDHCGVNRARSRSYLLRNVETGEIKQVGSSCLSLFLGVEPKGLWALAFVDDLDEYRTAGDGTPWSPSRWTIERVVRMSYAVTDGGKGFVSKAQAQQWESKHASAGQVETVLTFRPRPRTSEEFKAWIAQMEADAEAVDAETIAEIIAYADTLSGDYGENMRVLTNSSVVEHRHLGLLVSLVGVWYRGKVRQAEEEAERKASLNEWLPAQVKDRLRDLELLITDIREYDGDFDVRTKINFRDAEGRTLQWWASGSKDDLEVGATVKLTGTVKKLDTYQDRKITQLTRCTYSVL